MNGSIRAKLSAMMFLEFFIWGAWFVTLSTFLNNNFHSTGAQNSSAFSTQSWGAIIAPFIIGLIADRYFNAEKILGILHLIGAVLMYMLYTSDAFGGFYLYLLVYMILYMPTLALVNSVAFNQVTNSEKDFGSLRVFGTIGWIVAGLLISYAFHWDNDENAKAGMLKNTFLMTAIASAVMGIFSFSLPKTPPKIKRGEKVSVGDLLGLDALKLLKDRNYLVFFLASVAICIPLAFYYQNANLFLLDVHLKNPTGAMTVGQGSEVIFMLLLPVFFTRFGLKKTLVIAMAAWAVRYLLFAHGNAGGAAWMLIGGIALHGVCYDFFFVTGQIYTDTQAGEKYKSAAQGLITLATYGVGMLVGFKIAGMVTDAAKLSDGSTDWRHVWMTPAIIATAVLVLFMLLFRGKRPAKAVA